MKNFKVGCLPIVALAALVAWHFWAWSGLLIVLVIYGGINLVGLALAALTVSTVASVTRLTEQHPDWVSKHFR